MLFYTSARADSMGTIRNKGIQGEVLLRSIAELEFGTAETILVINPLELLLEDTSWYGKKILRVADIPVSAICNIDPYLKPHLVIAGGGFLLRQREDEKEKEIALIYRREKWDIPKGKLDPGESYEACAIREVQEELGIEEIQCFQPLGSTWHCYERKGSFCVKRTYWYQMETSETTFHPQEEEDIEEVAWFPWSKAKETLGFPIFAMHMEHVEPLIMG